MAKKVQTNLLLTLVAIVLSVLTAVTFFLPTYGATADDVKMRVSASEICFTSYEEAEDIAANSVLKDADALADASFIMNLRAEDSTLRGENELRAPAVAGAWLHFAAFIASILVVALLLVNMLMNKLGSVAKFSTVLPAILMIASLICVIVLTGKENFPEDVSIRFFGVIFGLITAIGTAVVAFIPAKKAKRAKK